jgi:hypothetical protein
MDLQTLSNLFSTTLSGDVNARRAAELEIMKVSPSLSAPHFVSSVYLCMALVCHRRFVSDFLLPELISDSIDADPDTDASDIFRSRTSPA